MNLEVIEMLATIWRAGELKGNKGPSEYFASRLKIAVRETSMVGVINRLIGLLDCEKKYIGKEVMQAFLECQKKDEDLYTLRAYADLVAIICGFKTPEERKAAVANIPHIESDYSGTCKPRRGFEFPVCLQCETPLAHGSDEKSGNTVLFNREDVLTESNGHLFLPRYSGNALRGLLRRQMAMDLTRRLGLEWSTTKPPYKLWFFYVLTSGGSIGEKDKEDSKSEELVGKGGVLNLEGVRRLRQLLPGWSVFGGNIGQKSFEGRVIVNELRPECIEWGTGSVGVNTLFEMNFAMRKDDFENPAEYNGMLMYTEMLSAGTYLEGGFDFKEVCSPLEKAAFYNALNLLINHGYIGAKNSEGFGKVSWHIIPSLRDEMLKGVEEYGAFIEENKERILEFLNTINALEDKTIEYI